MQHFSKLIAISLAVTASQIAFANMRRPIRREVPPSRHPRELNVDLEVQSEDLDVSCDREACQTTAIYRLVNVGAAPVVITTQFVAPALGEIQYNCNDSESVTTKLIRADKREDNDRNESAFPSAVSKVALREATIVCNVPVGPSTIKVDYVQPIALEENDVSYFTSSWFLRGYGYELAPLREWRLTDKFILRFKFEFPDKPLGFFARLFGAAPDFQCMNGPIVLNESTRAHESNKVISRFQWGLDFPDHLKCEFEID